MVSNAKGSMGDAQKKRMGKKNSMGYFSASHSSIDTC
jgi:hypothetical protein